MKPSNRLWAWPGCRARQWIASRWSVPSAPDTRVNCIWLCARVSRPASLVLVEHHTAHAASAYFASPFQEAAVLTLDRMGDFRCGARWLGEGNELRLEKELYYPDSLGDLYGRVTELLGFRANAEEHKVQWLSTAGDYQTFISGL